MNKRLVVGIDAGLNATKIVGNSGEISFPSLTEIQPPTRKKFRGAFAQNANQFEVILNNEVYLLGEHAQQNTLPGSHDGHDGTGSKNDDNAFVRAIGGICLYLNEYEPEAIEEGEPINVYLAYGTPINSATDDDEVEEIEDRFINNDKPIEVTYNQKRVILHIKDILVLPEGAAAFFAEEFKEKVVYIVDAGSRTINFAALADGAPIEDATGTLSRGVEYYKKKWEHRAAEQLAKKIFSTIKTEYEWPKDIGIHICGGFSDQIAMAFNDLYEHKGYHMDLINPMLSLGARKQKRPLLPIYANAAGLFILAKDAFATPQKG